MVSKAAKGKAQKGFSGSNGGDNVTPIGNVHKKVQIDGAEVVHCIEKHVQDIESYYGDYGVQIMPEKSGFRIICSDAEALGAVDKVLSTLGERYASDDLVDDKALQKVLKQNEIKKFNGERSAFKAGNVKIAPKSLNQQRYLEAIDKHPLTFGVGPAGSGKTYLAIAKAVEAQKSGKVKKIVLSRPAVDAEENIGFLPGELEDKLAPYLRPLYDALNEFLGPNTVKTMMSEGIIEIAPVGFMRGRDLKEAFIVIDEAQNTTVGQAKMIVTRIGRNSNMVMCGDVNQCDLGDDRHGNPVESGLAYLCKQLAPYDTSFVELTTLEGKDVVRSPVVTHIIGKLEREPDAKAVQEVSNRIGLAGGPK